MRLNQVLRDLDSILALEMQQFTNNLLIMLQKMTAMMTIQNPFVVIIVPVCREPGH